MHGNSLVQSPAGKRQLPATHNTVDHTITFIRRHEANLNADMKRYGIKRSELIRRLLDEKYPPPPPALVESKTQANVNP